MVMQAQMQQIFRLSLSSFLESAVHHSCLVAWPLNGFHYKSYRRVIASDSHRLEAPHSPTSLSDSRTPGAIQEQALCGECEFTAVVNQRIINKSGGEFE